MDAAKQQAITACGNCGQPEDAHKFRGSVGRDDLDIFATLGGPCTTFVASDATVIYARHLALAARDPVRKPGRVGKRAPLCRRCLRRGHQAKDCPAVTAVLGVIAAALVVAVLVLACVAAMLWAAYGPQGLWVMAWLVAVFAVVTGAVLAWFALQPEGGGDRG